MTVKFLIGDVREELKRLPTNFFDCVVTSPPYWGLRDYGTAQWVGGDPECSHADMPAGTIACHCGGRRIDLQIGMEPTLGEHIRVLVEVFREVRRVLKLHGTCWLNYGDCYAAAPNGKSAAEYKAEGSDDRAFRDKPFSTVGPVFDPNYSRTPRQHFVASDRQSRVEAAGRVVAGGYLKPKDLCMMSNRLAIALQDDGWWVRSEIVWHKPNPMPESCKDRPTSAHEKIWLLTKSEDYYYDAAAIAEPVSQNTHARVSQDVRAQQGSLRANGGTRHDRPMKAMPGTAPGTGVGWGRLDKLDPNGGDRGRGRVIGQKERREQVNNPTGQRPVGPNSRIHVDRVPPSRKKPSNWETGADHHGKFHRSGREPGVGPKAPARDTGVRANASMSAAISGDVVSVRNARNVWRIAPKAFKEAHFATFPPALAERCIKAGTPPTTCTLCGEARLPEDCGGICARLPRTPGHVLDPFGGAGTVGLVAEQLGLNSTIIELSAEYVAISTKRIYGEPDDEAAE